MNGRKQGEIKRGFRQLPGDLLVDNCRKRLYIVNGNEERRVVKTGEITRVSMDYGWGWKGIGSGLGREGERISHLSQL